MFTTKMNAKNGHKPRQLYLAPGVFKKHLKGNVNKLAGLLLLFDEMDRMHVIKNMADVVDIDQKKIIIAKEHADKCIKKRLSRPNNFLIYKN